MSPSTTVEPQVWLITGCSSGFGREIALAARKRGDLVIATARKIDSLKELQALGCEALTLDVTSDDASVKDIVAKAHAFYGRIDVLVNNAGFAAQGAVEESTSEDVQAVFETNVFGLLRVTRAVLPYMREKRSGTIANVGSGAGYIAMSTRGIYSATKFAVAGLTQSLREEVADLGIKVTVIEPARFQTNGGAGVLTFANPIKDYEPAKKALLQKLGGKFPLGDAAMGAQAVVDALTQSGRCEGRELPSRLPLGGGLYEFMNGTLEHAKQELDAWVDFTNPEAFAFDS
ncbi:hypothetical protein Poli38472_007557 [Pythium oligandrum]|uniref:Uncharacterized protein n=1 Tax=Pythium oligandrum TaxID=41045 RepID=A0A8K1CQW4_PYTOL|nr:hypothetical protein Poli38472_007557 [Pythium oligandrum]|eukprot:TMW67885.1 hypothetical protein Poli38472_007557 [Pythium oligandrum]